MQKLKSKLAGLEQEKMKAVNAYYRKHKTLEGCPLLTMEEIEKLKASMARDDEGAWQRQLTDNAIWAAKHLDCLQPLSGERSEPVQEPTQDAAAGWNFYIIADLKTWADNAVERSELEHFPSFEAAKARFDELRGEPYNSEAAEPGPDGQPPARLTLGLESADGMSAADILHVRQGKNYLVTDFVRSERLRDDPAVMDILSRVSREIGFDRVRVWEQVDGDRQLLSTVPFAEWDNPCFSSATPGRSGANQLSLSIAGLAAGLPDSTAVQNLASALMAELAQYSEPCLDKAQQQKPKHKKSQER